MTFDKIAQAIQDRDASWGVGRFSMDVDYETGGHIMTAQFWAQDGVLRVKDVTPGSLSDTSLKWHALHALASSGELVTDGGLFTCALCQMHMVKHMVKLYPARIGNKHFTDCPTCPIQKLTGLNYCGGTPYKDYVAAVRARSIEGTTEAAKAMIEFLARVQENEARQKQEDSNA